MTAPSTSGRIVIFGFGCGGNWHSQLITEFRVRSEFSLPEDVHLTNTFQVHQFFAAVPRQGINATRKTN
jgi:hypothetical protein